MDMFDEKEIAPMLIGAEEPAFDDPDYIYELKLDGVRCIVYADGDYLEIRNKRNVRLLPNFPELKGIQKQIKKKCILDGELYIFKDGRTDFSEIQRRALMNGGSFKTELLAKKLPASFTAFDVLYLEGEDITKKPLMDRKKILDKLIKENDRITISRYIENDGITLYNLTKEKDLEGIVAKKKDSKYFFGKRTKEWIKCKNMIEIDYVITGYIHKDNNMISLILGLYDGKKLIYKGHATLGASLSYVQDHSKVAGNCPFAEIPEGNERANWIQPHLVGTVKFMEFTTSGGMRQPVFKGYRDDKKVTDCTVVQIKRHM